MSSYKRCLYILILTSTLSCSSNLRQLKVVEDIETPVDYNNLNNWAAHPNKQDNSDLNPEKVINDISMVEADVFFIHPTTYTQKVKENMAWNASIEDDAINQKTDKTTIFYQASAFNQAGRVFAPRYRQMHLSGYFTNDKRVAKSALDNAYQDIRHAFQYYIDNWNHGRPIIIASHSQGTNHAERLISEFFDNKESHSKLVVAYLLGMPVTKSAFNYIKPCEDQDDLNCFVSWRTFKRGYHHFNPGETEILITNPLTWKNDTIYASKKLNSGGIVLDFYDLREGLTDAQVSGNVLWASKPKFRGGWMIRTNNFHAADINFYYNNIRQNAKHRVLLYQKRQNNKD